MRAAWYERHGPAREVLQFGEMLTPEPGPGELRVKVAASVVHVSDLGKRAGSFGSEMPFPRVIPHSDGAGIADAVGPGVPESRVGERVWVFLAQSHRPFGTAAEYTVVPAHHAVELPSNIEFEQAGGLGIPGITGHRAIFADGSVNGHVVVVTGATGAVGRAAVAVARRDGATVIATVRRSAEVDNALEAGAHYAVDAGQKDVAEQVLVAAPNGVDRVAEVAFDQNVDLDVRILRIGGVIATYATGSPTPTVPYWPLGVKNITVRFLGDDDFPEAANQQAAKDLTEAMRTGELHYPIAARFGLEQIADAHEMAENAGAAGRVIVIP
jgi:NADPH:quinone reductase